MTRLAAALVLVLAALAAGQSLVTVPGTDTVAVTWTDAGGTWWKASLDGGATFTEPRLTSFDLMLRYARFDPLVSQPEVPADLAAGDELAAADRAVRRARRSPRCATRVRAAGATPLFYLPHHADIVDGRPGARCRDRRAAVRPLGRTVPSGVSHVRAPIASALDASAPAAVWNIVAIREARRRYEGPHRRAISCARAAGSSTRPCASPTCSR